MSEDPLVVHAELIAAFGAGGAELEYYIPSRIGACILDLAAEVRALEQQLWDSEMARLESAKEIAELRERLAAQEPDAALARLVREGRELLK